MKRQMARVQMRLLALLVVALASVLLATPLPVAAQQAGTVYQVGHLSGSSKAASTSFMDAFREGMRALGYVEGQHWVLDERYAEGKVERLASLAQELLHQNPDVLLVSTTPGNVAAQAATSTIPIVMVAVADPVGVGLVHSLARPGGNITGITNIIAELAGKRLELLKELVPTASRIAVLMNPDNPNATPQMQSAEAAARSLGLELHPVLAVRSAGDLEGAFEMAVRARAHAALRMIDPLAIMLRRETAALAAKHRLPVIYAHREDVEAGGLVAYGTNLPEQYRQAATFVHKILRGAKPADLPVEQPMRFELVINLQTAQALGLTIPPRILFQADEVLQEEGAREGSQSAAPRGVASRTRHWSRPPTASAALPPLAAAHRWRSASSDKGCAVPLGLRSRRSFDMDIFLLHTGAPWPLCVLWMAISWVSWGAQVHSILS